MMYFKVVAYMAGSAHSGQTASSSLQVIKKISCSTQLSMKFFLLLNVKMPIVVGILTFMSRENSILGLSETEKC